MKINFLTPIDLMADFYVTRKGFSKWSDSQIYLGFWGSKKFSLTWNGKDMIFYDNENLLIKMHINMHIIPKEDVIWKIDNASSTHAYVDVVFIHLKLTSSLFCGFRFRLIWNFSYEIFDSFMFIIISILHNKHSWHKIKCRLTYFMWVFIVRNTYSNEQSHPRGTQKAMKPTHTCCVEITSWYPSSRVEIKAGDEKSACYENKTTPNIPYDIICYTTDGKKNSNT